jgi:hypothetical protein
MGLAPASPVRRFPLRPGTTVVIRRRRWRIDRVVVETDAVRFDVARHDMRRTFFSPFDRPVALGEGAAPRRVRGQAARARLAGLVAGSFTADGLVSARRARADVLA